MTVENCIRRYKEFKEKGNLKAAEDMKQHIFKSKKFKGHPFIDELKGEAEKEKSDAEKAAAERKEAEEKAAAEKKAKEDEEVKEDG